MKHTLLTNLDVRIEAQAWMKLENPDKSIEDAVLELTELGNTILEVDAERRRVKVMHVDEYPYRDVYQCDYCPAYSIHEEVAVRHEREEHGVE